VVLIVLLATACSEDRVSTGSSDRTGDDQVYEADLTVLESPDHGPQLCSAVAESYPPQCGGPDVVGWDWDAVDAESANGTTWGAYHVVGTWDDGTFTLTEAPSAPAGGDEREDPVFAPGCDEPDVVDPSHGRFEWDEASAQSPEGIPGSLGAWISRPDAGGAGTFAATVVVTEGQRDAATTYVRRRYGGPLCVLERDLTQADIDRIQQELHDEEALATMRTSGSSYDLVAGVFEVSVWVVDDEAAAYARDRWGDLVRLEGILQPPA
jgi:hypothetical protein